MDLITSVKMQSLRSFSAQRNGKTRTGEKDSGTRGTPSKGKVELRLDLKNTTTYSAEAHVSNNCCSFVRLTHRGQQKLHFFFAHKRFYFEKLFLNESLKAWNVIRITHQGRIKVAIIKEMITN